MITSRMPEVGDIIANRYELVERLGHGGFGVVYRARQNRNPREVAIKLMHHAAASAASEMDAEEFKKRFRREAIMASNLSHPHAVQQFDFGEDRHLFYLSMELVRGETMAQRIEQQGPMSTQLVARIGYATLDVLRLAHAKDIVHRDLKPENIMLCTVNGQPDFPKVLDFGAAKTMQGQHDLTKQGVALGSPAYMSPEVLMDEDPRPASDIYSLGLTLGEAIMGHKIVAGNTPIERLKNQVSPNPLDLPKALIEHPLFPWLSRALEKDPAQRYDSANEMLEALADVDISGIDLTSSQGQQGGPAQRTALMSADSIKAQAAADDKPTIETNILTKETNQLQQPEAVDEDAPTELIGLSPDESSLLEMLNNQVDTDQSDTAPTEQMEAIDANLPMAEQHPAVDLGAEESAPTELLERPPELDPNSSHAQPSELAPTTPEMHAVSPAHLDSNASEAPSAQQPSQQADDFHQATTEALPAVDPNAHQHTPDTPMPGGLPAVDPQAPQRQPSAPSPQRTEDRPQKDQASADSDLPDIDDSQRYGGFGNRESGQSKKTAPDTDIMDIKATADKDYMTVRTSDKRSTSLYMPALIIGAALLIIATFIVYIIAV